MSYLEILFVIAAVISSLGFIHGQLKRIANALERANELAEKAIATAGDKNADA